MKNTQKLKEFYKFLRTDYQHYYDELRKVNPQQKTFTKDQYNLIIKEINEGKQSAKTDLTQNAIYLAYEYLACLYVSKDLDKQKLHLFDHLEFEDSLSDAYTFVSSYVQETEKFPTNFKMFSQNLKKHLFKSFVQQARKIRKRNADYYFSEIFNKPDKIIQNANKAQMIHETEYEEDHQIKNKTSMVKC